jgi:hypothetical protein
MFRVEFAQILKWDISLLAAALSISEEDTLSYFTDGRRVSFILERRISSEIIGGVLASSEGAGFDLVDPEERKWEVRSLTKGGIYFCPSYMVGSGRQFEEEGFLEKLADIEGYIVSDVTKFPNVPVWKISSKIVRKWYF